MMILLYDKQYFEEIAETGDEVEVEAATRNWWNQHYENESGHNYLINQYSSLI